MPNLFGFFQDRMSASVTKALYNNYLQHKIWLFRKFSTMLDESDGLGKLIAGLASNIVTAEPHDAQKLEAFSAEQIDAAQRFAEGSLSDAEVRLHAAEASWWLSQLRLLQGTSRDASSPTKNRVDKDAYDEALGLIQRAITIDAHCAKYYATLSNTYLYGLDFFNAQWAAIEALELDPTNPEARRLKATAEDFNRR